MIKTIDLRKLLPSLILPLIVAVVGAFFARNAGIIYSTLTRPPFSPPAWIFPIVWTVLYILIGIAYYTAAVTEPKNLPQIKLVYIIGLALNLLWPLLFFTLNWYGFAVFDLVLLIIAVAVLIVLYYEHSKTAALLMLPYALWLIYALYLNAGIVVLN